jgi:hypothetical protein
LKREVRLSFIISGLILFHLVSCGKKAPPSLPERGFPLAVRALTGEWENDFVRLEGNVASRNEEEVKASDVVGCRIYHAGYDLENSPCEGCPIDFQMFEEIKGTVVEAGKFQCRVSGIEKKGIHFFKVRLLARKGVLGPSSNVAKVVAEETT